MKFSVRQLGLAVLVTIALSPGVVSAADSALPTFKIEVTGDQAALVGRDAQGNQVASFPLKVIKKGSQYYHWTSKDELVSKWSTQGKVDTAEMDARFNSTGGNMGGGVYTALDSQASSGYGSQLMTFTAERDLYVFPHDKIMNFCLLQNNPYLCSSPINNVYKKLLKDIGVQAVSDGGWPSQPYVVWFDEAGVRKVRKGRLSDVLAGSRRPEYESYSDIQGLVSRYARLENDVTDPANPHYAERRLKGAVERSKDGSFALVLSPSSALNTSSAIRIPLSKIPANKTFYSEVYDPYWKAWDAKKGVPTADWKAFSKDAFAHFSVQSDFNSILESGSRAFVFRSPKELTLIGDAEIRALCQNMAFLDGLQFERKTSWSACRNSNVLLNWLGSLGVDAAEGRMGTRLISFASVAHGHALTSEEVLKIGHLPKNSIEKLNLLSPVLTPGTELKRQYPVVNKVLLRMNLTAGDRVTIKAMLSNKAPLLDPKLRKLFTAALNGYVMPKTAPTPKEEATSAAPASHH